MTANNGNNGNGTVTAGGYGYWIVTYSGQDVKTTLYLRKEGRNNMIGLELPKAIEPKDVFDRLTVVRRQGTTPSGVVIWLCKCACGALTSVPDQRLASGQTTSCGCHRRREPVHGQKKQFSWQGTKGAR